MVKKRTTLSFDVDVAVEEREGYFAATTNPFAITVYSDKEDKAEKRALKAVSFLLSQHDKTPQELSDYLNRMGVKHVLSSSEMEAVCRYPVVRSCRRELRVEVSSCV